MELENANPEQDAQTPSAWDKVDALSKKPESIWDQVDAVQQDPRAKQIDWMLQQAASKDPERAANVIRLTNRYKLPETFVEKNYERLADEEKKGNLASEDLVNKNPILADAIAQSPNYSAAAIKHLPALKQLELLYTRPPELLPQDEKAVQAQARNIAKLKAAHDWGAGMTTSRGFASQMQNAGSAEAGIVQQDFFSQQEMEDSYYRDELDRRIDIEKLMGSTGPMNFLEKMAARFPGDEGGAEAFYSHLPFFRFGPAIHSALEMADAKRAVDAGTADEIQKDAVKQAQRIAAIQKVRGTGFVSGLGEKAVGLPAMATEFGVGFGLGKAFTAGMGKLASFFLEPAVGAATAGLPEATQTFIQNKGEGDSTPEALAKSARDAYATYLGAGIFGPWFAKATPEAQTLIKESLLKTIPLEALKMPAMNAATEILKAVGPGFAEHLKQTEVWKAIHGDPEAIKGIIQDVAVGAGGAAYHAAKGGSGITAEAQAYADASLKRHELLHTEMSKDAPELAQDISKKLADAGPNKCTRIPVASFIEHYGDEARTKAGEMLGDPEKFDHAKKSGADLIVPTAVYDHTIGAAPAASKFFANEIRPEEGGANLREAKALEKAYNAGVRLPNDARKNIVAQIVEQAKGDKIKESLGLAQADLGSDKVVFDTLGLSDQKMADLGVALGKARKAAEDILAGKEQERRDKLKGDLYDRELKRTAEQVTQEVDSRKEQIALARLQKHQLPNGTPLAEDVPKIKISQDSIREAGYQVSSLPRGVTGEGNFSTWGEGSAHGHTMPLEEAALNLGFSSGHDLMMALAGTNRELAIKQGTDSAMAGKFPLGLQPSELPREALNALHNPENARYQHLVLEHLSDKTKDTISGLASRKLPKLSEITEQANREIVNEPLATLNPDIWLDAEKQAKTDAAAAAMAVNVEDIFDARLKELHAHERYRIAQEVADEVSKGLPKLADKAGASYLNNPKDYSWGQQYKNLLRKVGLIAVDPRELATMEPDFEKWAEQKFQVGQTRGEPIRIDPRFLPEDQQVSWQKNFNYQDYQSLRDTLDRITYLAKLAGEVGSGANKIAVESWQQKMEESVIKAGFEKRPPLKLTDSSMSPLEKVLSFAKKWDASLDRPEPLFDRLDNNQIDGPINEHLWQRQVDARVKYAELRRRITEKTLKLEAEMPREVAKHLNDRLKIDGLGIPITRGEAMALISSGGNESSYSKLVRGEAMREGANITEEKIQEIGSLLTEAEKDHIQQRIDLANILREEANALHIWATGKPMLKIEAKQMIKAMGDRPGGYYPAMYDPRFSKPGEVQVSGEIGHLMDRDWVSATTDSGARQERVEEFAAPMDFNLSRLASHLDAMAKDIAFRPFLMDGNKLVSASENILRDYLGTEYKGFMREWMKRVVGADSISDSSSRRASKAIGTLRHMTTVATLGLKPSVALHHALGVVPAIDHIGPEWFAKGYGEMLSRRKGAYDQMNAESPEMAHYLETFDTNIRKSLDRLEGKSGTWADMQKFVMKTVTAGNIFRVIPTYFGAKAKAIAELSARGVEGARLEELAIRSAEKAVRVTSGSGQPGDIPAIMKSDAIKMLLPFYGPGSVLYSRIRAAGHEAFKTGGAEGTAKFLFKALWAVPAMGILHAIVSARLPNEDKDETYAGMLAKDVALTPASALPMGQELARAIVDASQGKAEDITVSSPILKAIESVIKAGAKTEKWYEDEAEFEDVAREVFKVSGHFMGAPTDQLEITAGNVADMMRGRGGQPNDMLEFLHDLAWRRPPSRR